MFLCFIGYSDLNHTYFYLENQTSPDQLVILGGGDEKRLKILSSHQMENCEVDNAASSYFGCDGAKVSFRSNQFAIISKGRSDADGGIQYFLKVRVSLFFHMELLLNKKWRLGEGWGCSGR